MKTFRLLEPIPRAGRGERIPLSFAQQRLWFLAQMEGVSEAYHIFHGLRLRGGLDVAALRRGLDRVVERHEALRTTFGFVDGEPVQRIQAVGESRLALVEQEVREEAELDGVVMEEARGRFDLEAGPLIRGRLIRLKPDEHVLLITMHHIVSDGWSMGVLIRELSALYGAFVRGQDDPLPELQLQYADYAMWQRKWMEGEKLREQAEYWKAALAGAPELLELPADHVRPAQQDHAGERLGVVLDEGLTGGLKKLGQRHGATLHMTLLAGWAALLGRLSGQLEVVIGTPVANRSRVEIENLIGFFVNTLALRVDLSGSPKVGELLERVKGQALAAQQHQDIPFEQVVELVRPARSLAHSPLFQVVFAWQNASGGRLDLPGLEVKALRGAGPAMRKFDLTLSLGEAGGRIVGVLEYATSLYERSTMERYLGYFRRLLEAMVADESQAVDRVGVLSEAERRKVVYEWNATEREYPRDKCVHELFEEQVGKTPEAVAVVFEGACLSYGELNRRANRLAHYLRGLGVKADGRVAICAERGFEMIVGLLGVLKAGGAYVPLDPAYPAERLRYMLEDSAPVALLKQGELEGMELRIGPNEKLAVIDLAEESGWSDQPESNPDRAGAGLTPEHLAYVIYTSGSTGLPKGVMVEHKSLANLIHWHWGVFELECGQRTSSVAGFGFDAATWEIGPTLSAGAALVLASSEASSDPEALLAWWKNEDLDVSFLPTPMAQFAFTRGIANSRLHTLLVGGDYLRNLPSQGVAFSVVNNYGPTEATVVAASGRVEPSATPPPIGRPIANTRIYILDEHGEPVPVGVAGELYIGGAGVARGYLNRPELTAERFMKDPFVGGGEERMYRTGDLGRWLEDGNIEFLGRNDYQVKIRGFRIELGEIEGRLAEHEGVREAVVVAREDAAGDRRLVAYYTGTETNEAEVGAERLRGYLLAKLPEYMVPGAYVRLKRMPLTANGKLDRKALPAPEADAYVVRGYEAPQTPAEEVMAGIWAEVLKLERVGRHDNFFELGGHSLLVVSVIERMRRIGLQVDVRALFATPTLAALAASVSPQERIIEAPPNRIPEGCESLTPEMLPLAQLTAEEIGRIVSRVPGGAANVQDIYPLAPLQEGILFHHLMGGEGDPYLLASQVGFDSRARLEAYLDALRAVIDRHDILRTAVQWEGLPEPLQVVWRKAELVVEEVEADPAAGDVARQLYERCNPRRYRMDVRQAPLLRVCIARDEENDRWVMVKLLHHLAGDHSTLEVMQEEIREHLLGEAEQLPAPLPFRSLVAQARLGVSREEHEAYFRKLLGDVEEPTAPFGLLNVRGDGTGIGEARMRVDAALARRLRERTRKLGVSAASVCHVAWAQVLAKVSGREDVVFGTVLFGRMRGGAGTNRVMGPFINTLPVRIRIGEEGAEEAVRRTHGQLAELLGHEHASLALVQKCSGVPAPLPLFSALLNYRHSLGAARAPSPEQKRAGEGMRWIQGEERTNYPFTLSVDDLGEGFGLTAQVEAPIAPMRVCQYMHGALGALVEALETAPERAVRRLEVLPEAERRKVVYEWNATEREYPRDKCIHELFEEQVGKTPEAVAVVFEGAGLSYGELNRRANRLAHYLRGLGVKADGRVAICAERGFEMIVGLLGVLKAGGAYVPLDPAYPVERLRYILEDSAPVALLKQGELPGLELRIGPSEGLGMIDLAEESGWSDQPESNPDRAGAGLTPEHLAYVIYTSGSTGLPKGVMVEHGNVVRLVRNTNYVDFDRSVSIGQVSNVAFDASTFEIWGALLNGCALAVISKFNILAPNEFARELKHLGVSTLFLTTVLFNECSRMCPGIFEGFDQTLFGGEMCDPERVRRALKEQLARELIHVYGPTETTTFASYFTIKAVNAGSIPIGRPIANTRIYILDEHGEPVPVGVAGELYIGGAGVARGYLNRPELTRERFMRDPFTTEIETRMYRTGDLGRWLEDGNIEFLGRNDYQVKVRGFRIELGEIEARLAEHEGVREAVVVAREDAAGDRRLVAYYTGTETNDPEAEVGPEQLRGYLLAKLPDYMVPGAYVRLERMPLTANGKLDRKALPAPEADAYVVRGYEAPQTPAEEVMAGIWAEVLKLERVGRHDNFFELGGHSLLVVSVIERMRRIGLQVDVRALFATPTLAVLAASVSPQERIIEAPPNRIPEGCESLTPEMLPLAQLGAEEIGRIVSRVPGGAANVQDIYPLAPLQEGILFHHLMGGEGDPYLLASQVGFDSRARLEAYLDALRAVIDRHDILRTAVQWEGLPEPLQVVWRKAELVVEEVEPDPAAGDVARQLYERCNPRRYRMDVRQAPLLRVCIARDDKNDRWVMVKLLHHLAGDHSTLEVMQEEIGAHLLGEAEQLPAPLPFRNLVAQARLGVSREEHEAYFRKLLGDVEEPTAPFGLLNVRGDGTGIGEARMRVDAALARRVRERARKLGVSAASVCHVAWAQVLAKVSGREDVVFGTVLFGRMRGGAGADRVMGLFINMLPVRIRIGEEGAEEAVRRTHGQLAELLGHEHASLALAQRCSAVAAPLPLFSAGFNYRHSAGAGQDQSRRGERKRAWEGIRGLYGEERSNYPFSMLVDDLGEGFALTAQVEAPMEPMRVCQYMHGALGALVEALETAPERAVRRLEVMPEAERRKVVYEWNATEREYPRDKCIHELFEEQVGKTPGAVAVVFEGACLSYGELNRRANRLAHYLRGLGVKADGRVAICAERGFEMIVGLLGVLKAGGAYVPLDPAYPVERLRYMLEDSAPVALLKQGELEGMELRIGPSEGLAVIDLAEQSGWSDQPESNPDRAGAGLTPEHLAYVIYTSGSTGLPKGVMVEHRGLCSLALAQIREFAVEQRSRVLQFASFSFDACISESVMALCRGASLNFEPREELVGESLARAIKRDAISHVTLPPAVLASLPERAGLDSVRVLIVAGDTLTETLAKQWGQGRRLINAYGPTEATVCATIHELQCEEAGKPPIGRPIANTRIYILDEHGEPVPVGVAGELYIGGAGVARGYLNRPELTRERFMRDPFTTEIETRMYRTGDLGRWLEDGNIEFLGRNDYQVKIRGFRIELGEIEARLAKHEGVREAVVVAREDAAGDRRLVAYYTGTETNEAEVGAEQLRGYLLAKLPDYMVPGAYVRLERMPLTANGKLDRKALPAPEADAYVVRGYEAPQTPAEEVMAGIWAEVLKLERVGRHDNFFELGGHSLLAVQVIERLRRIGLQVDVRALFATPTLAALAASVSSQERIIEVPPNRIPEGCESLTPEMLPLAQLRAEEIGRIVSRVPGGAANVQDIYPLAPLQEGILFHHLMGGEGDPYLGVAQFSFDSRARLEAYLDALRAVIDRHDILRTAVQWEGLPEPLQVVWRKAELVVEEVEADPAAGDVARQMYERCNPRRYRMDVRQAPLLRVCIARDEENDRWVMTLLLHHMVIDHSTLEVMQEEIRAHLLGEVEQLPAPLPFRNLVAQARLGVSREEHEAYFRKLLGDVEEPTAPFGLLNVRGDGTGIREARMRVDAALAGRLRERARKLGVSAASVCHLAWAQVLAKVCGREDVVFGTVLFGRMRGGAGADRVMGLFINTLPVRIRIGDEGAEEAVRRTHGQLAELLGHEHASLALAQRCSAVPAPTPLFSAFLNYRHSAGAGQDQSRRGERKRASEGIRGLYGEERTNYPFTLSVDDLGEGFGLTAQVEAPMEPMRVCQYMHGALGALVEALETAPERAVRRLEVLPEAERRKVVYEWNATEREYPRDKCVHELFEEQVGKTPEAVAVVFEGAGLSYGELNRRANRLAHYLRGLGVKADGRVAICAERGFEMIVGLLGVLKAGGAYVPLDPAYPVERLRYMLEDSAPVALLKQGELEGLELRIGPNEGLAVIDLAEQSGWSDQPESNPDRAGAGLTPEHLAYVIYTSGSTGLPKGVMVEHKGLRNYLTWAMGVYGSGNAIVSSSLSFDATVTSLYTPLLSGGAVGLLREREEIEGLHTQLRENVTCGLVKVTPGHLESLGKLISGAGLHTSVRTLVIGGETLSPATVRLWRQIQPDICLVNEYGPTETVVGCIAYQIPGELSPVPSIPIGRPIANTRIYILDEHGEPVPVGVAGELYIGGAGVARGYLNRPELTAERFMKDPFVGGGEGRMYRTGDLGRWLEDGNIEFLGRNDYQVKIRGFRIELGEIEARLAKHEGVREAVVVAREDAAGDRRLVAYYTGTETNDPEAEVGAEQLRGYLLAKLPEYMVPGAYVRLERMPLTANGKLDRKALPAPESDAYVVRGYEAPQTPAEEVMAGIWAEVLKLERVGRHDNFFELGGHSLLVVSVIERMRRIGLQVDVRALFATPTLAALAASVSPQEKIIEAPPNRIPEGCESLTPEMLPLAQLTAEEIGRIVSRVPGGAANVQDIYPLAPLQEGILFHHLMGGEGDPYLLASQVGFDSRARLEAYLDALRAVIDRHDILRTAVQWEGLPEPLQVVWRKAELVVEEVEADPAAGDVARQLYERCNPRRYRMDVRQAPLLRVCIARDEENDRWVMVKLLHHLAGDHSTLEVTQEEIRAHLLGEAEQLPAPLPFRNLVAQARLGVSREEHEAYFRKLLGDVEEPTAPFGLLNVRGDGTGIGEARMRVDAALARRLRERARKLGVSAASVCHVAWAQVLAKVSGREDVVFGTVLFGRMRGGAGADRVMGLFINTLPVRIRIGEEGAEEAVRRTHGQLAELLGHEHASLALAQRCSAVAAPLPLFSAGFNYRHSPGAVRAPSPEQKRAWEGMRWIQGEERTSYPFTLSVDDLGEGFGLTAQVEAPMEPMRVCQYMHGALGALVEALETAPERAVRRLEVMPEAERRKVVYEWNATEREYPRDKCIHELFEEQVGKTPEAVAVVFEGACLSYGELNRRANRLAHYLRGLGVKADGRVAICAERGFEMIVGLLGVLKAGGAYVPLDPAYPVERLRYMLEDSAPVALLKQGELEGLELRIGPSEGLAVIDLAEQSGWSDQPESNPDRAGAGLTPEHLAYVIYTSGSTGLPKGVMVEHKGLRNYLTWAMGVYGSGNAIVSSSLSFDATVTSLYTPLLSGGAVGLLREREEIEGLHTQLRENVTCGLVKVTPGHLESLGKLISGAGLHTSVRTLVIGGETLSPATVRLWRQIQPDICLVNEYGPTETVVGCIAYQIPGELSPVPSIPIGRPIANTRIYILDEHGEPVPVGVAGELYIGGAGVARGYLNRPELTAERFMKDPFVGGGEGRMYRTGDLGRWLEDGNIEFLGRNDYQVKIRGFRIELGEIEGRLAEHEGVREAVVVAREDAEGDRRLVAYYTGTETNEAEVGAEQLRGYLLAKLPDYMVPGAYVRLERMPLTANGKLDRKALPAPEADAYVVRGYEASQTPAEEVMAGIWADVLKLERVGRRDNFFELGGHSLLAVQVIARVQQILGVEVAIDEIFDRPVLAEFAGSVTGAAQADLPGVTAERRGERIPLSFAQQRLWFLAQMEGVSETYHIPFGVRLRGGLDVAALRRGLDRVVERHEALRTTFGFVDGEPVQRIQAVEESRLALVEQEVREEAELNDVVMEEARGHFDLEAGPLIRGRLIRLKPDEHVLLITMHHIVSDGWSMGVLIQELSALYGAFVRGQDDPLPELQLQYADYAMWQRKWMEGEKLREQAEYWKAALAGAPELLELPADHVRPAQQDHAGERLGVVLDEGLTGGLKKLGQRHGATLHMTLLAGWAALLGRLSGQLEVVIGTPVANRSRVEIENLIGFFVNTLALRVDLSGSPKVGELLERVKGQALAAQQHQDIPFEQVVELVRPARSLAHSPLFQVMLVWQNASGGRLDLPGLEVKAQRGAGPAMAKFDLTLSLGEAGGRIVGVLEYATSLYERSTMERYLGYFRRLLEAMVADESQAVDRVGVLSEAERRKVVYEWNATEREYPRDKCIHELFEEQVGKTPEAVAVVFEGGCLSYGELNRGANRLAHYLRGLGVKADGRVAICAERGFEMIVGLLGVLKAGGAYVPLDPAYPVERLRYMLEDSAPVALLKQGELEGLELRIGPSEGLAVIDLAEESGWSDQPESNPDRAGAGLTPEHLAYVIYTSGSTGLPKGVAIEHGNAVNFISWAQFSFPGDVLEHTLFSTSLSFDLAVYEWLLPITVGAKVEIVPNALELSFKQAEVTVINTVPSTMKTLVEAGAVSRAVRMVNLAGEPLKRALIERIFARTEVVMVCNLYGPSETTTYSTWVAMKRGESLATHVGRPIANTRIYILDEHGEPVPVGVAGELYIGGAGVARGYLNRPELTAERFMKDPFVGGGEGRMYRTGDLGRWLEDGNIEFLGRNDYQVKIRGFRIELGEIEGRLAEHEGVREAVVVAREDAAGDRRLVAYYTGTETNEPEVGAEQLRGYLLAKLPEYMVPGAYVRLERMPLTANGKLDRKALPAPEADAYVVRGYEAPQTPAEEVMAGIWAEVLKVERVGRHDNFFELGGHSLLAVQVIARLRQALGVEVAIRDLFTRPGLGDFARGVESATRVTLPMITPAGRGERIPLSFAQQRLWFLAQMEGVSEAYHIPFGVRLRGGLDVAALRRGLDRVVERHEALRTTFGFVDGEPVQRIQAVEESRLALVEQEVREEAELDGVVMEEARGRFDLEAGPLIRGRLIRLKPDEHVLLITMHHIVSDGWSMGVLIRELSALYGAFVRGQDDPLPELQLQYADYAMWQRKWMEGEKLREQAEYWKAALAGAPELLELPADHVRPAQQDHAGERLGVVLDEGLTGGLKKLGQRHGATLHMTLLAGWAALLGRLSGQLEVVIGTPVANRSRVEIENLIGFFVNTLALRVDLSGSPKVGELLERVKGQALAAQQHQDIPFEQVVELVQPARSLAHSPLFQVMLVWQNASGGRLDLPGLEVKAQRGAGPAMAKFDLTLSLGEAGGRIVGVLEYATSLYERSTMERYLGYFRRLLEAMVADESQAVDRVGVLSEAERRKVVYEWNATEREYPQDKCVHELFEEQVGKTPEAVAVVFEGACLSYGELNRRANRLAHYLRGLGVKADGRVAICAERGFEMIVGLLGVLKAGGAYVPLDPAYPVERLRYMLEDSAPVALLKQGELEGLELRIGPNEGLAVIDLAEESGWSDQPESNPDRAGAGLTPEHLAYVIYTSGSTGLPKGVMVEHKSLANLIHWHWGVFELECGQRTSSVAGFGFDAATWEIGPTLSAGAALVLASSEASSDPEALLAWWKNEDLDVSFLPTPMAQFAFTRGIANSRLHTLLVGGDYLRNLPSQGVAFSVVNNYGPTEATIVAASGRVEPSATPLPIGRPIANTRIYILDEHGEPVPVGVAGELYIGGAGVARGYLNRPELTAERFMRDPFTTQIETRMYRTGDLGRWLEDGNIEFLGRNDYQVKIRGFRIELGEIEARLVEHEGVREAVVVAREDAAGDRRLVAYYTGTETNDPEAEVGAEQLRGYLLAKVPEYMVPGAYVRLERMPLTANGKLDRKALPAPEADAYVVRGYEAPQTPAEEVMAGIWTEVLKLERVGRHDNFFELGGHSLLAVQVIERMRRIGLQVDVRALFATPTLAALAASVGSQERIIEVPPNRIPEGCQILTPEMLTLL